MDFRKGCNHGANATKLWYNGETVEVVNKYKH